MSRVPTTVPERGESPGQKAIRVRTTKYDQLALIPESRAYRLQRAETDAQRRPRANGVFYDASIEACKSTMQGMICDTKRIESCETHAKAAPGEVRANCEFRLIIFVSHIFGGIRTYDVGARVFFPVLWLKSAKELMWSPDFCNRLYGPDAARQRGFAETLEDRAALLEFQQALNIVAHRFNDEDNISFQQARCHGRDTDVDANRHDAHTTVRTRSSSSQPAETALQLARVLARFRERMNVIIRALATSTTPHCCRSLCEASRKEARRRVSANNRRWRDELSVFVRFTFFGDCLAAVSYYATLRSTRFTHIHAQVDISGKTSSEQ